MSSSFDIYPSVNLTFITTATTRYNYSSTHQSATKLEGNSMSLKSSHYLMLLGPPMKGIACLSTWEQTITFLPLFPLHHSVVLPIQWRQCLAIRVPTTSSTSSTRRDRPRHERKSTSLNTFFHISIALRTFCTTREYSFVSHIYHNSTIPHRPPKPTREIAYLSKLAGSSYSIVLYIR